MRRLLLALALCATGCAYRYPMEAGYRADPAACGYALAGAAAMKRVQYRPPAGPYPALDITPVDVDALAPMAEWQAIRICQGR